VERVNLRRLQVPAFAGQGREPAEMCRCKLNLVQGNHGIKIFLCMLLNVDSMQVKVP